MYTRIPRITKLSVFQFLLKYDNQYLSTNSNFINGSEFFFPVKVYILFIDSIQQAFGSDTLVKRRTFSPRLFM